MPPHRGNRDPDEADVRDLASLSSILARVQRIASSSATAIARKIGFAVGPDLASVTTGSLDVHSELTQLFRRLSLGRVTLREWGPVVFVDHTGPHGNLEAAFGEGVLEGIIQARSNDQVFFKHSTRQRVRHCNAPRSGSREILRRSTRK